MIARTWRGAVRSSDADAYADYMEGTGVAGYRAVPGNRGVWMLRRDLDSGLTEFVMFTLWESVEAIKRFAGEDYATAVFYPRMIGFWWRGIWWRSTMRLLPRLP